MPGPWAIGQRRFSSPSEVGTSLVRSAVLRRRLALIVPALFAGCERLAERPQFERIYAEYLFLLHSMVRAAVPLMVDAVETLEAREPDELSVRLIPYLRSHILEEEGHDRWLIEDLEQLGVPRDEVLRRMPSPAVAELVGAQYYWIRHHDPVALLGYIAVLEGYPSTVEGLDELAARTGLPVASFRTLREHAVVDVDHNLELDRLIDELPLDEDQFVLICVNASMTVLSLTRCVEELLEDERALEHLNQT